MAYNPEAIRETYDVIAEQQDEFEKRHSLRNEVPREFIKKYIKATDIVLDAGGGAGINAIMMAQSCRKVTLLDISPKVLEQASMNIRAAGLAHKIRTLQGDITNLGQFRDGQFSLVVCVGGAISYVQEKGQQAIHELVRVAKQGAILIVGCDSKYGFMRLHMRGGNLDVAARMYETGRYKLGKGVYSRLYTVAEIKRLLEEAGCGILEVGSAPTLMVSWGVNEFGENDEIWEKLLELELKVCTEPELTGMGHHLFCVARKE